MNASPNPSSSTGPKKAKDYGNILCAVMFLSLMVTSLLQREWIDVVVWGCFGTAFAVMSPALGIDGDRWKRPRSLVSIGLVLAGIVFLLTRFWLDFAATSH